MDTCEAWRLALASPFQPRLVTPQRVGRQRCFFDRQLLARGFLKQRWQRISTP
jgi:hypothetical protein